MVAKLQTMLVFGVMTSIVGWRPFDVKVLNETYAVFHPEVLAINLTIKNQRFIDLHINIVHDIKQLFLDLEVKFDSGDGTYNMGYMNRTTDLCMFLRNSKTNPFLNIIYRILTAYGDLPKECPMRKRLYNLLNVFMDPEKFPPFMPDHKASVRGLVWNKVHGKKNILIVFSVLVVIERSFKNSGA